MTRLILHLFLIAIIYGSVTPVKASLNNATNIENIPQYNVLNYTTSILLNYTGSECGKTPTTCPKGQQPMSHYLCSSNEKWNYGKLTFMDPIPTGNTLFHISLQFLGRYFCDSTSTVKTMFVGVLDDAILLSSHFPQALPNCTCETNCGGFAYFQSDDSSMDYSVYNYGEQNYIEVWVVSNDVCLSSVNMTFHYQPVTATMNSLMPTSGPTTGGTEVTINGSGWTNSTTWWCLFNGNPSRATYLNDTLITCVTPAVSEAGNVTVQLSVNLYQAVSTSPLYFVYTGSTDHEDGEFDYIMDNYWWVLLIGCLIVLMVVSFFILTFKAPKKNTTESTPLLTSYVAMGSSSSLILKEDIDLAEIKMGQRIGRGNFGEVYLGYWRTTRVAVKKLKINTENQDHHDIMQDFAREASIMRSIRHPNVLQFLGICDAGNGEIYIITEYMPRGSLYKILHDKSISLDWDIKLKISIDIARGMNYLHFCVPIIIHRDLKSHNLLVDENFKVKVCDFGLAKLVNTQEALSMTSCGTPAWTAPEVLRNEKYDEKCDCYSFGIVLWELLTREDPHHGLPPFQVVFAVGTQGTRPIIPSDCPPLYSDLIQELWHESPKSRPSFEESIHRLEEFQNNPMFKKQ